MFDLLFVALLVLYLWFGAKVDEWTTISILGFKLETPQGFLEHSRAYSRIRSALFLLAIASVYGLQYFSWYIGVAGLFGAWFATTWLGQRMAFNTYRRRWREGLKDADSESDRAFAEAESQKTNAELREHVLNSRQPI